MTTNLRCALSKQRLEAAFELAAGDHLVAASRGSRLQGLGMNVWPKGDECRLRRSGLAKARHNRGDMQSRRTQVNRDQRRLIVANRDGMFGVCDDRQLYSMPVRRALRGGDRHQVGAEQNCVHGCC
jgi:hypothetical protein